MVSNVTRENALAVIASERTYWDDLVTQVGPDRLEEPGAMGDWTFKDLAAHITAWRQRSVNRLDAASRGEPEPPPPWPQHLDDTEEINDWIYARNRERSADDVLHDARDSFDQLARVVGSFSDDNLNDPDRFPWMNGVALGPAIQDGSFFGHLHEEHEGDVREFLATNE